MAKIRVGISGWTYEGWRKNFYPEGLVQKKELEYASSKVDSIEINGTFYALQKPDSFLKWYEQTPKSFVFAIKANRYITHVRRLNNVSVNISNFFASGLLALEEKLGPILWQFPPNLQFDPERWEAFLKLLPHDTTAAVKIAKKHDNKVKGRAWLQSKKKRKILHAIEVRNPSFHCKEFLDLLKKHKAAFAFAQDGEHSLPVTDFTADFAYFRMHGQGKSFAKGYPPSRLNYLAKEMTSKAPKKVKKVFVYFDNDEKAHAPKDAMKLIKKLKA